MRFDNIVSGLPVTRLVYWEDPYRKEDKSNIIAVAREGNGYYVVLDSTIFHPKSGGQPSDTGIIKGKRFTLQVKKCFRVGKHVVLWGKGDVDEDEDGEPKVAVGEVIQKIHWDKRYLFMRRHATAHLFDAALEKVIGERCDPVDSWLGDCTYVGYRGEAPSKDQQSRMIEFMEECIAKNLRVTSKIVQKSEINEDRSLWRAVLESLDEIRIVQIDDFNPVPCGGTHVETLGEVGRVEIREVKQDGEAFRIYYDVLD